MKIWHMAVITSLLWLAVLVIALAAITQQAHGASLSPQNGDVNGNGVVNSVDSLLILQLKAGLIELRDIPFAGAADVNNDGVIDAIDAALILQFDAGIIHAL